MSSLGTAEVLIREQTETVQGLVFAIAHEVGNHLGGIRLHSHLLDEELTTRELADASVSIDRLAGRSGPLLVLLRPLLSDEWKEAAGTTWQSVVSRVAQQIQDQGTQGVGFEVQVGVAETAPAPGFDWLHPLLVAFIESTIAEASRGQFVRLSVQVGAGEGQARVVIEDDGPEEDVSSAAACRGRPLCLALARELVGRAGGQVNAGRVEDTTRIELILPS